MTNPLYFTRPSTSKTRASVHHEYINFNTPVARPNSGHISSIRRVTESIEYSKRYIRPAAKSRHRQLGDKSKSQSIFATDLCLNVGNNIGSSVRCVVGKYLNQREGK